jgi:hypothetical protein
MILTLLALAQVDWKKDLSEGLKLAKELERPAVVHFTGEG